MASGESGPKPGEKGLHPDGGWAKQCPTIRSDMADREDKNPENVSGKFYVDSQCIDCDLCRETAPANFTRQEVARDADEFKRKFDGLWADFKNSITG